MLPLKITDGAITSIKIATGAVTVDKIAAGAVRSINIYLDIFQLNIEGVIGQIRYDNNFLYICTASYTSQQSAVWKKTTLT